jgi:E3 ubiquitin-protein ligase UBR1
MGGGNGGTLTYIPINQQLRHLQAHPTMEVESIPFKSKRFTPIFSDLRYLMQTRPVQRLLADGSGVGWVGGQGEITFLFLFAVPLLLLRLVLLLLLCF